MKKISIALSIIIFLASCNNKPPVQPTTKAVEDTTAIKAKALAAIKLDYKKDPVCQMPTRLGIEDTMMYKGKIIGFCGVGCKKEFVKNPAHYTLK